MNGHQRSLRRFRPSVDDRLEDRVTPGITPTAAIQVGGQSSPATLSQAVPAIQQLYANFANNVRQIESTLVGSGSGGGAAVSTVAGQVAQQVQTLAQQVAATLGQVPQVAALAQQQIGGPSGYGLLGAMDALFAAQAGGPGPAGLATLSQGVEGLMANSYAATASDLYLAEVGGIGITAAASSSPAAVAPTQGPGTSLGMITGPTVGDSTGAILIPLCNGTGGTALAVPSDVGTGTGSLAYETGAGTVTSEGTTTYPGFGEVNDVGAGSDDVGFGAGPGPNTVSIVTGTDTILGSPPGFPSISPFAGPVSSYS
jgi:hypothetical protein